MLYPRAWLLCSHAKNTHKPQHEQSNPRLIFAIWSRDLMQAVSLASPVTSTAMHMQKQCTPVMDMHRLL